MALSRRELVTGATAGLLLGGASRAAPPPRSLLVVLAYGGWDTSYTFDPKFSSPHVSGPQDDRKDPDDPDDDEDVATFGGIRVAVNAAKRPNVSAYFERWAAQTVVINGVEAGGIAHAPNRHRVLTGTGAPGRPDLLSIVGAASDPSLPFGAVDLTGSSAPASLGAEVGRFGRRWQLGELLAGVDGLGAALPADPAGDALVEAWLAGRTMDGGPDRAGWLADRARSAERLQALRARRGELAELLAHPVEKLEAHFDLAASLVLDGWCRAVMVNSQQYFDTHTKNSDQHGANDELFAGLTRLVDALDAAGALERTLVVVVSEMTRAPQRNDAAGKDHWPSLSYLAVGGGIAGGRTLGATDDWASPVPMDLATGAPDPAGVSCRYNHVAAGVLTQLDLDPDPWLPGIAPLSLT